MIARQIRGKPCGYNGESADVRAKVTKCPFGRLWSAFQRASRQRDVIMFPNRRPEAIRLQQDWFQDARSIGQPEGVQRRMVIEFRNSEEMMRGILA